MFKKIFLTLLALTGLATSDGFNTPASVQTDGTASTLGCVYPYSSGRRLPSISDYDDIIRAASEAEGMDWRLMSAIAYHESRFEAAIVSRRGAVGLMQIMPVVCRHLSIENADLSDPMTNVRVAGKLLNEIERMLGIPADVPYADRMSIVLASYNGGVGHVADARRLARSAGENPDSWEVVARYLKLQSTPEYYTRPEVRSGRFTGVRQTTTFVNEVMSRYEHYRSMTRI